MKAFTLTYKRIYLYVILLCSFVAGVGQTTLAPGDIAINGFNSTDPDQFTFVILRDITNNTVINFTDNGWFAATGFRDNEGTVTWTATSNLYCGTEVIIESIGANLFSANIGNAISTNNGFGLAVDGDQILAYQGLDSTPTFIYAIDFNSTDWTDATSANDSALPTGLVDGVSAVNLGESDNGIYNCAVLNDPAVILAAISTDTNWILQNTVSLVLGGCYYTCCINTTTWDGAVWDFGIPNSTTEAVINADYFSSTDGGSFTACSLNVNAGILLIQGTDYVEVVNDVSIDGTVRVASEASLIQVNDLGLVILNGTGIGEVQKTTTFIDDRFDYTYWSSPFANETVGSVFFAVPVNRIFRYDAANFEDTNGDTLDDNADDWIIAGQLEIMEPGRGYAAFADQFAPLPGTQTFSFDGQFNNGVITPAITMSPGPNPLNWNLLGNPYPSAISADLFLNDPVNAGILGGTLYFWTHNSDPNSLNIGNEQVNFNVDDYASYNSGTGGTAAVTGGIAPNGTIASGQGFFVEGISVGVATFNNSMRLNTGNTTFYRTTDRIWLNFKNDFGAFSQILIGFNENATDGFDNLYDSKRLDIGSYISFFSFIDDEKYAIQSRSELLEEEIIPLGIKTSIENDVEYSISIDKLEGKLKESEIYLLDNLLGTEHNLNKGEYKFNAVSGEYRNRFALSFKTQLVDRSLDNELVILNNKNISLEISTTHQSNITNIQIYDMLGRLLLNEDFNEETKLVNIDSKSLNKSIYIVKTTLQSQKVITKKILH